MSQPRPLLHFTPPAHWLNDPNGLVYQNGEYHLFYQHHPHSLTPGPMHWGHAVSHDLLRWEHLPIALAPDEHGMIFSGSAVVDENNTAGFGANALLALYTAHKEPGHLETQCLAFSLDGGRAWTKYAGNPVLPNPGLRDFRDPKVFWHADGWVMCLAAGREILFYTSPNLKDWTRAGSFAPQEIPRAAVLETPDLFELPVGSSRQMRWVLTLGINSGAPAGGSGSCYFVGGFDGFTFTPETFGWMNYGPDFYAPQTWNNAPNARRICLGWMNNWQYAAQTPASEWRGMFSIPRELTLVESEAGISLAQNPIVEVNARRRKTFAMRGRTFQPGEYPLNGEQAAAWDVEAEIALGAADCFGCRIGASTDEETILFCDVAAQTINVNRARSGQVNFHKDFATIHSAPLPGGGMVALRILFDYNSVEVFVQNGRVVLSESIFPAAQAHKLTFFVAGGALTVKNLKVFQLQTEAL